MKNNISFFTKCANCGACWSICPTNAITVDSTGVFYSLKVDDAACIHCGKCVEVCPVNSPQPTQNLRAAFGGYHRDPAVVAESSSGGAFHALAQQVLKSGGVVFGAAFSEDCKSVVFRNTDECDLKILQKSKYVESHVGDTFRNVLQALQENREVLFCGTPCQVAGLKRYLGQDYNHLYTCDFSCGGLPSHQIYKSYLNLLEREFGAPVAQVDFRPKTYGWETHSISVAFANGKKYEKMAVLDPFFRGFLYERVTMRDYCYTCDFADNHAADVILADFWLHKTLSSREHDNHGLSLLLANSEKGEEMLHRIRETVSLESLDITKASYNIKSGHLSEELCHRHKAFVGDVEHSGFCVAAKCWLRPSLYTAMKQSVKEILLLFRRKG